MKHKNPRSFTITCIIDGQKYGKVHCNLGININFMVSSIFKKLKIDMIKPNTIYFSSNDG